MAKQLVHTSVTGVLGSTYPTDRPHTPDYPYAILEVRHLWPEAFDFTEYLAVSRPMLPVARPDFPAVSRININAEYFGIRTERGAQSQLHRQYAD